MEKLNQLETVKGAAELFTGEVWYDVIYRGAEPSKMRVNVVRFSPGARTAWHCHAVGRTLHVTEGVGIVQTRDGNTIVMRPGDTVFTPAGEWHWHGAYKDRFMTHIAMWESAVDGTESEWGEHVSKEHYLASQQEGLGF